MSGSSSANSWTILTSEVLREDHKETAAETLRPVAADTQQRDRSHASTADEPHCEKNHKPPNGAEPAEGPPVEDYLISKETSDRSGDLSSEQRSSLPTDVTETHPSSCASSSSGVSAGSHELSPLESPAQFTHGPNLFSDVQTLPARSADEPTASLLGSETLRSAEFEQDEEKSKGEEGLHLQSEEQLHQGDGGTDHRTADLGDAASAGSPDVGQETTEKTGGVGEQQEQEETRRKSLLSALEQIGRREEEEDEEEEFHMPQREDDSVLSLNKCILGAVILLGIGTIFFSEGDHVSRELRDSDAPGKQEWLGPEAHPPLDDGDGSELLNKLAKGNQQISVLQAQLQSQNEELKVARGQAAEGAKERQRWEEVEKENSRLKTEMASLPDLQSENERMKKELESVPALQKELETLRSTVTELKLTSANAKSSLSPSPGQLAASSQPSKRPWEDQRKKKDLKNEKFEGDEKKQQKRREKPSWKEEEKQEPKDEDEWEWKKWKQERGTTDKPKEKEDKAHRQRDGPQQLKEKDRKKEKTDRGDDGKLWKEKVGERGQTEKSEKREWMEKKEWKKEKHVKVNQEQQWGGKKETKEWKGGKDHGQHKETEGREAENVQMKGRDGKEQRGKDWKEKGDTKERKKEHGCRDASIKNRGIEGKGGVGVKHREDRKSGEGKIQNERKRRNEDERKSEKGRQEMEWKGKDEKMDQRKKKEENWKSDGAKEKKSHEQRSKDKRLSGKNGDEHKPAARGGHADGHLYGEQPPPHTHRKPAVGQPEYWARQRTRLQHDPRAPQHCDSLEACAQAERLRPVPLAEFEAVLQNYLVKAKEAGVEESNREELRKLASGFFKDGVFMHTQMSFQSFAEDVADILEDFVEVGHEEEEDSELEEEMEGFEMEVMEKFSVEAVEEKGQRRKEDGHKRG
ncbi:lens epithelial cell protein LEP503 isoform X3 [Oryzias latipes]|uniref:lens epithelial cell protein LEP503 isoform X3 n=1 Tax=Oryzias latipes TaxID=8090 RepID=UPI0005CC1C10|nr:lens epithelial cell protein LEP503 isoform X3 [Oryzias latipes]